MLDSTQIDAEARCIAMVTRPEPSFARALDAVGTPLNGLDPPTGDKRELRVALLHFLAVLHELSNAVTTSTRAESGRNADEPSLSERLRQQSAPSPRRLALVRPVC